MYELVPLNLLTAILMSGFSNYCDILHPVRHQRQRMNRLTG